MLVNLFIFCIQCVLSEEQCASPRTGWFSHINAERAPGIESFTAVDLSWDPTMSTQREYVITYRDLNSSYMLSMRVSRPPRRIGHMLQVAVKCINHL